MGSADDHAHRIKLAGADRPAFSAGETRLFGAEETEENRATLGKIEVVADDVLLTEAVDQGAAQPRRSANLPAYQMANGWLGIGGGCDEGAAGLRGGVPLSH